MIFSRLLSKVVLSTMTSSNNNMSKFHRKLQVSTSSLATKTYKVHKTKKTRVGEAQNLNSLFNEICDILGSENTMSVEKQSGAALPGSTHPEIVANTVGKTPCTLDVCENANEKEILLSSNNKLTGTFRESDISSTVHKITAIVRDENVAVSMEERLTNACLEYNEEIVEKVLKRCFKVPYLAFRFFNWVRSVKAFRHNTLTYNVMIYMAAEAKDSGLVDALLEEMVKNSCEKNIKTWSIVISHCGNTKSIGKALSVFERMKKHGPKPDLLSYKLMLNALCNTGKADIAFEFYKEMKHEGMFLDERSFKNLLKCLAAFGDIVEAHIIINDMIRTLEVSEHGVYGLMLKTLCISGRIREALELIREMMNKNVNLESDDFVTLVKGLCKVGMINDALEIVDITKKRNAEYRNLYDIVLHEYLRRNEFPKALDLMQKIKDLGHLPSLATYTTLMKHFFRANECQKAVGLYHEMMDRGIGLDCVAMTAVITGYLRQNCISEAFEAFKEMKDKGIKPSKKFYSIFVKELITVSGTNGDILKLLKELEEASKLEPGDDVIQHVISHLKMKGEKNKLNGNREIHLEGNAKPNAAKPEGESSDHHYDACWISRILSSSMDWWFIKEQLEKCSIHFTPEVVTEILHNSRLHAGMALQFFSWVGNRTGYRHTTGSYNMAIKIAGQGKDFKQMRSLFYEMGRKGCSITCDTWTIMIMQYGRTGLTHIALQTFRDMKERGYNPTGSTYKFLILCLCEKKGRNVNEAVKLFNEMIERGCIPDKELAEAYIGCLCEVGKSNDARSCVESLQKTGFTVPLSYSLYIRSLCRVGRLQEAFESITEVDDDDEQRTLAKYTYGSLIHGLLQRGSIKAALAKIESMKQIGVHPTIHTYTSLIVYYFKEKQIEKVSECLEEIKESGCEPTLVTYSALLRGYTNLGKVADAWSVFQHIKQYGPFPDFKTYSIFLSCLCRVGKSEEALQLITEMMNNRIAPSAVNFRTVFYGLNREGKQSLAKRVLMKKSDLKRMRTLSI